MHPKTGKKKDKILPCSTGLWFRYGNPIMAPDWWLNQLPQMFLDGELYAGRRNFQTLRSIISRDVPDDDGWGQVKFAVFGSPPVSQIFYPGEIKNTNFVKEICIADVKDFLSARQIAGVMEDFQDNRTFDFETELKILNQNLETEGVCYLHLHKKLSNNPDEATKQMGMFADEVLDKGGEGVMLRDPRAIWIPKRTGTILKLKPFLDDCGVVTGFISGRKTNKGSKLRGLIGAVTLDYNGKKLELSGFTDEERKFSTEEQEKHAWNNPGVDMPEGFQGKYFKIGDKIEFRYRELSDEGIPKEARYLRSV
jgi:DNA ligase-1